MSAGGLPAEQLIALALEAISDREPERLRPLLDPSIRIVTGRRSHEGIDAATRWAAKRYQHLDRRYVLEHVGELVVKAVNEAGGYGMLVGPKASRREHDAFRRRIEADPRGYIAQPLVELSAAPTWSKQGVGPRRVDLRPFVLTGDSTWVLPGGLTRVALVEGSYVVNSSQGGGSKDTWVVGDRHA